MNMETETLTEETILANAQDKISELVKKELAKHQVSAPPESSYVGDAIDTTKFAKQKGRVPFKIYILPKGAERRFKINYYDAALQSVKAFRPKFEHGVKWRVIDRAEKVNRPASFIAKTLFHQQLIENSVYFETGEILLQEEVKSIPSEKENERLAAKMQEELAKQAVLKATQDQDLAKLGELRFMTEIESIQAAGSWLAKEYGEEHGFEYKDANGKQSVLKWCNELSVRFPAVFPEHGEEKAKLDKLIESRK